MIRQLSLEEDLELKRFATTPKDEKPRFKWRDVLLEERLVQPEITVDVEGRARDFDLAEVAETIGNALTDLLLSRRVEEIFTIENQEFVAEVAKEVGERLAAQIEEGRMLKLSDGDIYLLIEKALIQRNAHDVAKSVVFRRSQQGNVPTKVPRSAPLTVRLIRRNGQVVPWNIDKIEIAVRKAFLSNNLESDPAISIAMAVTEHARKLGQAFTHIEDLQDFVQEELMHQGHYKVAEGYILYRAHRARLREEQEKVPENEMLQESMIVVRTPEGDTYFWDGSDLKKRIEFGMIGLDLCLDKEEIESELRRSLYSEVTLDDLCKTIILNAKALNERDADFSKFAGRILLTYIYEEVLGWDIVRDGIESLKEAHRLRFQGYLEHAVKIERLHDKMLNCDIEKLARAIDPSSDLEFDYLGVQTLYDRYLIIDKTGKKPKRIETPQMFWMRVAMGLSIENEKNGEDGAIRLYNLYKSRRFCSSTPTLFNSGTCHPQLSSCYLYKVDDNIESIMIRGIAENAFLSKWAGGLGGSWTSVRGTGSYIKGTNGESQGVIPFLKLHNDQLVAVNQGGKRRGSGCSYLETWHNDIIDFLELRRNTGDDRRRTHDMNTANWIPDLFMKRMEKRQDWTLFRSNEVEDLHELYGKKFEERYCYYEGVAERGEIFGQTIPAIDLWKKMLTMLFETGHPWITFKDPCNLRSPQAHVGVIHSSNLCTEITLNTDAEETAVCNLGSVVVDTHINANGKIDHRSLRETIRIAIRSLDNVIDINYYPTNTARKSNMRHRPIGLGIMGLQNALYKKDLSFASDEAIEFNDELMEVVSYYAIEASSDLARERGKYSSYAGSKWENGIFPADSIELLERERGVKIDIPREGKMDWEPLRKKVAKQGMRNSNVLAIAPTATISNIMGTSPCIEPAYKNIFVKSNLSGEFIVLNQYLVRDLKKSGLWDRDMLDQLKYFDGDLTTIESIPEELKLKYLAAFDIDFKYLIDAAARRQKWIDQSQSVNLFLGKPNLKTLSHMYRAAWHKGLKTTYYLRTLGASNIEKATISVKKQTRGIVASSVESDESSDRESSETEKSACSIDAMLNGEECEACQ